MTLEEAVIVFTPKKGKKNTLNMEEKNVFIREHIRNDRILGAFKSGIPVGTEKGTYLLENYLDLLK